MVSRDKEANGNGAGRKRPRSLAPTETPRSKRPSPARQPADSEPAKKSKYSYARAAKSALVLGIVSKEGTHITYKAFKGIQRNIHKFYMDKLAKNEWRPDIEEWSYTSSFATVSFPDENSVRAVGERIANLGYICKDIQTLREERRPCQVLSGLVQGVTAECTVDEFAVILKDATSRSGIVGRAEVVESFQTRNGNAILRIRVDDIAMGQLEGLDFELRIATAGKVKFHPVKKPTSNTDNRASKTPETPEATEIANRIRALEEEITKQKERYVTVQAHQLEAVENSSVSSMGFGNLGLADDGKAATEMATDEDDSSGSPPPLEKDEEDAPAGKD